MSVGIESILWSMESWVLQPLLHASWQAILLASFLGWYLYWSSASARMRYNVALTVLLLIGVLPVLNAVWLGTAGVADLIGPSTYSVSNAELPAEPLFALSSSPPAISSLGESVAPAKSLSSTQSTSPAALTQPSASLVEVVSVTLLISYLIGVIVMLIRLALAWRTMSLVSVQATQSLTVLPDWVQSVARAAADQFDRSLTVPVYLFRGSGTAMVVGVFRPMILLNLSLLSGLTPEQLRLVLAHELAHVFRYDPIAQLVQRVIECFVFFHPAMWYVSGKVSELREECCDQLAIGSGDPVEYAQTLVQSVGVGRSNVNVEPLFGLGMSLTQQRLSARVRKLLDHQDRTCQLSLVGPLTLAMLVAAGICILLMGQAWAPKVRPPDRQELQRLVAAAMDEWSFVPESTVSADDLGFSGQWLQMKSVRPEQLDIEVMMGEPDCRFAEFYFGDSASRVVTLVAESIDGEVAQLFCDSDRNGVVAREEAFHRHAVVPHVWVGQIPAEYTSQGKRAHAQRQVAVVTQPTGNFKLVTLGHFAGTLQLGNQSIPYRRYDMDGTGIANDQADLLQLDLNQDGTWDPLTEEYSVRNSLKVNDHYYQLLTDGAGHDLKLKPVDQTGTLEVSFTLQSPPARLLRLEGTLRSDEGHFVPISLQGGPVSLPVGNYFLQSLVIDAKDSQGQVYRMTLGVPDEVLLDQRKQVASPIVIRSDQNTQVDLLDSLLLDVSLTQSADRQPVLAPVIKTRHGLVVRDLHKVTNGSFNSFDRFQPFKLKLPQNDGLADPVTHRSGFS